jgi:phosphoenolpyruvate carboxykinase (GTP)
VNPEDDPLIWRAIRKPGEVIVSNILVRHGKAYWLGMGVPLPDRGFNHSGKWWEGKQDVEGKQIGPAHLNARYTLRISDLANMDPNLDNPEGIKLDGIIYGARDADTWLPVEEAFDWEHGVLTKGAILESESTAATLGKAGLRTFNPMANIDFLSIPIGEYLENHVKLGRRVRKPPRIFSANYFLRNKQGKFITKSHDKRVWLKWMELRVHDDVGAVVTPTGLAPIYEDLRALFKRILGRNYPRDEYDLQFKIRVRENLSKIERMFEIYREKVQDVPQVLSQALESQRERLEEARREFGDYLVLSDCRGKPGVIQEIRPGDVESSPREVYPNTPRTI